MITFVVGLPASGKTTYARQIPNTILYDDHFSVEDIIMQLERGYNVVVTDPMLCIEQNRSIASAAFAKHSQEWVYFANDQAQCKLNAIARGSRDVLSSIYVLSKLYNPPYVTFSVWKG